MGLSSTYPSSMLSSGMADDRASNSNLAKTYHSARTAVVWCDTPTVFERLSSSGSSTTEPSAVCTVRKSFGWRMDEACVNRILKFVESTKDLRSCAVVCKKWKRAFGLREGGLGQRVMNPWQPYSGVWWLPKDPFTIMMVDMNTENMYKPTGVGMLLEKVVTEKPSLMGAGYDVSVERHPRDVLVELSGNSAVIRWFRPVKQVKGARSGAAISTSVFDCSAVITLNNITNPAPGRVVPKQLYLAPNGGTLKSFPDSHLRRPKSHAHYHDLKAAADYLAKVLERSDWVSITSTYPSTAAGPSPKPLGKHTREI